MEPLSTSNVMTTMPLPTAPTRCWTGFSRRLEGACRALGFAAAAVLACAAAAAPFEKGATFTAKEQAQGYRDGVVLAKPRPEMVPSIDAVERGEGLRPRAEYPRFGHVRVLELAADETVAAAVARLKATSRYEYVEPDRIRHATTVPDDAQFGSQWGLNNTGSNAGGGGLPGADIHAVAGWNTATSAQGVIVGIIDSGAMLSHQDLVGNLWVNKNPHTTATYATQGAGGNPEHLSYTDDVNGLNAVSQSGQPMDDAGHGTIVSGIVGAVGNNSVGVCGVAWSVQLMELKFIDSSGSGSTTAELPCIEYAITHKVGVINASFGSQGFSQAEMDAIQAAGKAGIVFVCAAGNSAENIDISPFFPADYPLDNIIAVGASDNRDLPVYFTNYGSGSVELFAPGEEILSTYYTSASSYGYASGTSMAAPFVTGAVALLKATYPGDTYRETINRVLNCADKLPGLAGKAQTGGRLNLATALTTAASTPPNYLFANRTVLVGLDPYTRSNNADSPAALEAGTPSIPGATGLGRSLWWQWTAPENASIEIDTSGTNGGQYATGGSSYATALGVYTGASLGSLATVAQNATYGMEPLEGGSGSVPYSEVKFEATAGTTYVINVEGQGGASGQTVLAIYTDPDYDSISTPRVLSGSSVSVLDANPIATVQASEPQILGNAGGHSLWYSWTAPSTGTVQVSGYSYDFNPEVAVYTGTSFGNLNPVAQAAASAIAGTITAASQCLCTFTATAGTAYLIKVDGVTANDTGEFTLSIADSQWQALTGDAVTCSPAVGTDGTIYVGGNDNKFYAISTNGAIKWSYTAGQMFDTSSAVVGPDGTIYAGCTDGNVYAFNPVDGSLRWTYAVPTPSNTSLDNGLDSSPALAPNGTLYIHADDGNLYALNSSGGSVKWKFPVSGFSYAAPTIASDGTVYIGTDGGQLYAITPSGAQKWVFNTPVAGEPIYTAAAIDAQGNLYFGTLSGNFYSVDSSGTMLWAYSVGDGITSAPALANGQVYFGAYDDNLYALTAATGTLAWKYNLGTQVRASAPAVDANGVIYIGCYDHNVYAVSPIGSLAGIYASDDVIRSSPVIAGTMMYFGSEDHKVYAFNIGAGPGSSDWPMYQYNSQRIGTSVSGALGITAPPSDQYAAVGGSATFSVTAVGISTLSYQWNFNETAIPGATSSSYTIASVQASNAGPYTVTVTDTVGLVTSKAADLYVNAGGGTARLINISTRAMVGTGANILIPGLVIGGSGTETLLIRADGPALTQYGVSGVLAQPILTVLNSAGAMVASNTGWGTASNPSEIASIAAQVGAFALPNNSADCALIVNLSPGAYTVQVSGVGNTTGVALAEVYEVSSTGTSLVNISTRAQVGTGGNILIPGFVIGGTGTMQLLVRADGPALNAYGVQGVLAQPSLAVYNASGTEIASNTGWGTASNPSQIASVAAFVGAFALTPNSSDSAQVVNLSPGAYTIQVSGVGSTTGVSLAEVYAVP